MFHQAGMLGILAPVVVIAFQTVLEVVREAVVEPVVTGILEGDTRLSYLCSGSFNRTCLSW